jgi:hypothetical protein
VRSHHYKTQVASDIVRDGLGVELLSESSDVVAEVFRCDRDHTVLVSTLRNDIPLEAIDRLIRFAKERLEPFEDGLALSQAKLVAPRKTQEVSR